MTTPPPRLVSIAVLAHDEEQRLPATLRAILQQSLVTDRPDDVEIVVVANGCRDATAEVARRFFRDRETRTRSRVVEIAEGGKANAWNRFVREFADPRAERFVFVDADVRFLTRDTLARLDQELSANPECHAAVGTSVKDLELRGPQGLLERASAALSRLARRRGAVILCGQLYAIRARVARRIHVPRGLVAEDGFLKHHLVSDGFRKTPDRRRIAHVPGVGNVYESYARLSDIIHTQVRMRIGEVQIHLLLREIRRQLEANPSRRLDELTREDRRGGPPWLTRLTREHLDRSGGWVLFPGALTNRLRWLSHLPIVSRLRNLPLALLGTAADVFFSLLANRKLKRLEDTADCWTRIRPDDSGLLEPEPTTMPEAEAPVEIEAEPC